MKVIKIFSIIGIICFFNNLSFAANSYKFNFLVCDSLKNANYNFGVENKKKYLLIYKLKNDFFKKSKVKLDKKNYIINLKKDNYFENNIYLDLTKKQFYFLKNNEFLGGCFIVKSKRTMNCKLKSYYNVFKGKLPLNCA